MARAESSLHEWWQPLVRVSTQNTMYSLSLTGAHGHSMLQLCRTRTSQYSLMRTVNNSSYGLCSAMFTGVSRVHVYFAGIEGPNLQLTAITAVNPGALELVAKLNAISNIVVFKELTGVCGAQTLGAEFSWSRSPRIIIW